MEFDLRSIVLYLHKKKMSAYDITRDINETFEQNIIAYSTVTNYIRQQHFSSGEKVTEKKEKKWPRNYYTDRILKRLKDFPFSSIRQIAEDCDISSSTVYRVLTIDLQYQVKHLKWIPHILNPSQKVSRVELSKSLQKTLKNAKRTNYQFFYTGDESWFYLSTDHVFQWLPPEETPAFRERKTIQSKKYMLTVFWNPNGFALIKVLPDDMPFNAEYFINEILQELYEKTSTIPNKGDRKVTLHFDNARPHTARKVTQFMEEHHMKKAPQPAYSPDIAPSDFFLFGYLKNMLQGTHFDSVDSLYESVIEILNGISNETLNATFQEWERRLDEIIHNNGEYIE